MSEAGITRLCVTELADKIRTRELSAVEVTQAFLDRIDAVDEILGAYITVLHDRALASAERADRAERPGGPLHGVPIAIKDEGHLAGVPNSYGIGPLANFIPNDTAVYVQRLEDAGAVILGKTNMPDFGHKGVTDNRHVGPSRVPFALDFNAGGSSGGSAAAVAAHLAAAAQGGDGGGSIRIPASMSGVFGLKPSWGRVAAGGRPDGFGLAMPMVCYGPMTTTVLDAAVLLDVLSGPHPRDILCLPSPPVRYAEAAGDVKPNLRIAYAPTFGGFPVVRDVLRLVEAAVGDLERLGATVDLIEPHFGVSVEELVEMWTRAASVGYLALIETLKHEGVDLLGEHRNAVSDTFMRYVEAGRSISAVDLRLEGHIRTKAYDAIEALFRSYDFIVTPVLSVAGVPNGENGGTTGPSEVEGRQVDPLLGWALTYPLNFSGHPAASVPIGFTEENLPVGLQVIAPRFRDDLVLALGAQLELVRPWRAENDRRLKL